MAKNAIILPAVSLPVRVGRWTLALIHIVCPLLFFTNLTRNPYFTQIALLNIGIVICGMAWAAEVWRRGEWRIPRFPFEVPMLAFLLAALLSSLVSWNVHEFVRAGVLSEGIRIWIFTLVNAVMAMYLPVFFTEPIGDTPRSLSIWTDLSLAALWSAMWLGYHSMRSPDPGALIWDTYGAFLWALGITYALVRTRHGEAIEFFHLIFAVAATAGLYGIFQYWGHDLIWTTPIHPYGGRPVSSFGNPNFLSSHLMMVTPLAVAMALRSAGRQRAGYALVAALCAIGMLCTLTRSTYVGFVAAFLAMAALLYRAENKQMVVRVAAVAGVFVALILIFPHTPIATVQSPLARFTEIFAAIKTGQTYAPWHQRILIWSSAWDMLKTSPIFGIGWGTFELFYPFFQGKYLLTTFFPDMRTHANNAHNVLLEIWAQVGFLGMGAAFWWLTALVAGGWVVIRKKSSGVGQTMAAALLAAIIGMFVDNFFGNVSIFFAVPAFLFWWNVGSLTNESRTHNVTTRPLSEGFGRPALILFMVFCLSVIIYFAKRWKQEVYYFEGFKQAKVGSVVESYKALDKAYQWFGWEVNNNYELGNSYARHAKMLSDKGLTEEAKKYEDKSKDAYRSALSANPGYDEIYFNLGVTQNLLGERQEAARSLEMSLFINPVLRDAYGSLGNLYISMGDLENARRVFTMAVETFPRDKDFWNNLGFTYSQMKNPQKSFDCYKKAVSIDPGFTQGWQNLGVAASELKRHDPILEVPGLIKQMESAVAARNFSAALAPAKRIEQIIPDNPDAHLSLANIYFYLTQAAKAEAEYRRTIELKPDFEIAHLNLAKLYQTLGRTEEAKVAFRRVLEVNPGNAEARDALSRMPK